MGDLDKCPEAIGWHQVDTRGRCHWCRHQVEPPEPRPQRLPISDTTILAYRYFYDPDFGVDRDDVW
jgi:hypothetical protein